METGGSKRANAYAKFLKVDLALCYKQRKKANEISNMTIIGDVKGKDVVIIDDMIDTAGTLTKSAQLFIDYGASSVSACCTHPILSGPASGAAIIKLSSFLDFKYGAKRVEA